MVAAILTLLALAVVQLGLGLFVRNTLRDAAGEGARYGALLGAGPEAGVERTRMLIRASLADDYADDVSAEETVVDGVPVLRVVVRAPLPVIGLIGVGAGVEVQGHAAVESLG